MLQCQSIKQLVEEGWALRTETGINHAHDFAIGKRLTNLPALGEISLRANRRLLDVQRLSHARCSATPRSTRSPGRSGSTASAPRRSASATVGPDAALGARRLPAPAAGFAARDLPRHLAPLLGLEPGERQPGPVTYELRRLRLHGLIERIEGSHRYRVTTLGLRASLFFNRAYTQLLRPGLAQLVDPRPTLDVRLRRTLKAFEHALTAGMSAPNSPHGSWTHLPGML